MRLFSLSTRVRGLMKTINWVVLLAITAVIFGCDVDEHFYCLEIDVDVIN